MRDDQILRFTTADTKDEGRQAAVAELERIRKENEAQAAELEALRREKEEAEAAARKAEAEARALSSKIDEEVARAERDNIRHLHAQRKARIVIPSGRDEHERAPVPVAVNGREFLIERDKEVDVPQAVVNVLNLAQETVPARNDAGDAIVWKDVPRIAYTLIGFIDPDTGGPER